MSTPPALQFLLLPNRSGFIENRTDRWRGRLDAYLGYEFGVRTAAGRSFFGAWMLCFWSGQVVQMASSDLLTYWRVLPVYFWVLALAARA